MRVVERWSSGLLLSSVAAASFVALGCAATPTTTRPTGDADGTVSLPDTSASPTAQPAHPSSTAAVDHEFTPNDCEEMGRKYRDLHAKDLKKTMKPGLTPEQIQTAESSIADAAKQLSDSWTDSCRKNNVGTFAPEESLNCAMHAASVSAFDACLNAAPAPDPSSKAPAAKQSASPPATR